MNGPTGVAQSGGGAVPVPVSQGGTGGTTGRTAAAALGIPYILAKSAIPFVMLSSGSVSAPGAITAITALPSAYPNAYCYFPANALATSIAAGWYYCTFSTTTAGTAFLDTYTTGTPTIPASPVAVTDGKGAYTGVSAATSAIITTVPAGALGANGKLTAHTEWQGTNAVTTKLVEIRYSGSAGTVFSITDLSNLITSVTVANINNRAATNKQQGVGEIHLSTGGSGANANTSAYASVDTTVATTIHRVITNGTPATNNIVLESYIDILLADGT